MAHFQSQHANDAAQSIGFTFIKAYNIWHRKIKTELLTIGLTHPQFVVLASLGYLQQFQQEIKQIDLALNTDMDVMTTSTIVRNLEKLELIYRQPSQTDTRAKIISITNEGTVILNQALKLVEKIDHHYFSVLGDQKKELNQLLHGLIQENEV